MPLELAWAPVDKHRPCRRLDRPADHESQHAAGIRVEPVGRAGATSAEVLELPGTLDRLHITLLLGPRKTRRPLVAKADMRLDPRNLNVIFGLDKRGATVGVVLKRTHL